MVLEIVETKPLARSFWRAMLRCSRGVATLALCAAVAMTTGVARAQVATPTPPARQSLDDAWWTGPMLAAGASTLPRGHVYVEPYLFDVITYGAYNRNGSLVGAPRANSYGSLTYLLYGITDRFTAGIQPIFGYNTATNGPSSSGIGFGDLSVIAQYKLTQYHVGNWVPTSSLVVEETLPTGKYDRLGANPNDGFGGGAYTTIASFYTQEPFWLSNGRILRTRIDTSYEFSGSAAVNDASVYGTNVGFHGSARPGNAFYVDVSQEYSLTRSWVLAMDEVYRHDSNTHVSGGNIVLDSGPSDTVYLAPAVEYSWTSDLGVLLGVRLVPAGSNRSATITPAIAISIFH